ncbi:unnamed protein product, partial [marine sediment metagenome]
WVSKGLGKYDNLEFLLEGKSTNYRKYSIEANSF